MPALRSEPVSRRYNSGLRPSTNSQVKGRKGVISSRYEPVSWEVYLSSEDDNSYTGVILGQAYGHTWPKRSFTFRPTDEVDARLAQEKPA